MMGWSWMDIEENVYNFFYISILIHLRAIQNLYRKLFYNPVYCFVFMVNRQNKTVMGMLQ